MLKNIRVFSFSESKDFKENQNKDPKDLKKSNSTLSSNPKRKESNIKFFKCLGRGHIVSQCPTKKTTILKDNGSISSLDFSFSHFSYSFSSSEKEIENVEYAMEGDLLPNFPYKMLLMGMLVPS